MKNKFIKSAIILALGGAITKLLAMVIKICLTRTIKEQGIGLYMMILPTFNLFITLCSLSLSTSISKIISEHKTKSNKKIILSTIPPSLLYNLFLMFILIILSPIISKYFLKNNLTYYPILSIALTLPFICISSILKGYFYGNMKMFPFVISNIIEQIVRLLLIIFILPKLSIYNIAIQTSFVVLINILSELSSIICLIIYIPNKKINISDFKYNKSILKDILNISIPSTGSRLIGSISYFLEPIILTYSLTRCGYSISFIQQKYGILSGYVFPLLLIPSFLVGAISQSLLPLISKGYANKNYKQVKSRLFQAISLSGMIGICATIIFLLFPQVLLKLVFNTTKGVSYIKYIAPIFILFYIQGPLTAYLQAINKSKTAMQGTLYGSIIKNILLLLLPNYFGFDGFVISYLVNIIYITIHHLYHTYKSLN